jgi:hypothetical protein
MYIWINKRAIITLACASLLLFFQLSASTDATAIRLAVDTKNPSQDGLLVLYGAATRGGDIGLPVAAGDINGDGRADVAFCEMYASSPDGRQNNGQVNVYLSDGTDTGSVDAAKHPPTIFSLIGRSSGDLLGSAVAVGDVNGDGMGDLIVSASLNDGPDGSRTNAGAVYLVPGSKGFSPTIDLQTLDGTPPAGIKVIYGPQQDGRFGIWVDVGDVDGDGIADIVVGIDQLNADTRQHIGGAYIIFGSTSLPQVIDLASPPAGVRMTKITGVATEDHWGAALSVGDINNDGIADVAISAALFRDSASYISPADQTDGHADEAASDGGQRFHCGEVYVLYGSKNWPSAIDLRTPPANATHVIGANELDRLGSQLFSADLNGDGKKDLIIGALQALAPDSMGRTGAVYVVYGSDSLPGSTIDMLSPASSGQYISAVYGENNLDCTGDSVRAYDINGDGMAELFVGSPENSFTINGELRQGAGDTKIIPGQSAFLPQVVKLYDPPAGLPVFRLAGAYGDAQALDGGNEFSYRLTGGDVDGDGYLDYVVNAMHGDGLNNSIVHAGNVYVFSGKKLSALIGLATDQSAAPTITTATLTVGGQPSQQAPAGQTGIAIAVNGSGFRTGAQVLVNGALVISQHLSPSSISVQLDQNTVIRNTAGPLVITAKNTNPPSPVSNAVTAGVLTGPQISSANVRMKPSGVLILKINGSGFSADVMVSAADSTGQSLQVRSVSFIDTGFLKAKVSPGAASGATLHIRVLLPSGVQSNEVASTVP